jgi:hypothetical protein
VQLNYERARQLEGEMVRFQNEDGEWLVGKVVKVRKDGLEIVETSSDKNDGYGFGIWRPCFVPFGRPFFPFFWW